MSYPFDQFAAVAGANRQLALKCAEIMREAGQRQAAIASRTFELLSAQSAEKAGAVPLPNIAGFSEKWQEISRNGQACAQDMKGALDDWRAGVGDSLSPGQAQEQAAHVLQLWTSFFTPSQAGDAAAAKAPVTAPAKTGTAKPETDKT